MDGVTLHTFYVKAPYHVRTVELYGSWDNFRRPYRLECDRTKGTKYWTVCPSFHGVVYDGDKLDWSRPRNGPLKEGGLYWYYYMLDDAEEYCDPTHPTSVDCPLLPGQMCNFLDMPIQVDSSEPIYNPRNSRLSQYLEPVMTLDPEDRFKSPSPRKHRRRVSEEPSPPRPVGGSNASQIAANKVARRSRSFVQQPSNQEAIEIKRKPERLSKQWQTEYDNTHSSPAPQKRLRTFAPTVLTNNTPERPSTRPGSDHRDAGSSYLAPGDSHRQSTAIHDWSSIPAYYTEQEDTPEPPTHAVRIPATRSLVRKPVACAQTSDDYAAPATAKPTDSHQSSPILLAPPSFNPTNSPAVSPASLTSSPTLTVGTLSTAGQYTPNRHSAAMNIDDTDHSYPETWDDSAEVAEVEHRLSRLLTGHDGLNDEDSTISFAHPVRGSSLARTPSPVYSRAPPVPPKSPGSNDYHTRAQYGPSRSPHHAGAPVYSLSDAFWGTSASPAQRKDVSPSYGTPQRSEHDRTPTKPIRSGGFGEMTFLGQRFS